MNSQLLNEKNTQSNTSDLDFLHLQIYFPHLMKSLHNRILLFKATKYMMIKCILQIRKKSCSTLISFFQNCFQKKKAIKYSLVSSIIEHRKKAAQLIQSNFKRFSISRKYNVLYMKVKDCYSIYPSVGCEINSINMKVFLENHCQLIKVNYCTLRKVFVVDIPKQKVAKVRQLKVNFELNHQTVIDPSYRTTCENGNYMNIIDFNMMDMKENEINKNFNSCLEVLRFERKMSLESRTTATSHELHFNDDDCCCNDSLKSQDDIDQKYQRFNFNGRNTVKEVFNHSELVIDKNFIRTNKKHMTVAILPSIKSILKPCMSTSSSGRCLNQKKVCFGQVQFSF